jgi:hypothetical protein
MIPILIMMITVLIMTALSLFPIGFGLRPLQSALGQLLHRDLLLVILMVWAWTATAVGKLEIFRGEAVWGTVFFQFFHVFQSPWIHSQNGCLIARHHVPDIVLNQSDLRSNVVAVTFRRVCEFSHQYVEEWEELSRVWGLQRDFDKGRFRVAFALHRDVGRSLRS